MGYAAGTAMEDLEDEYGWEEEEYDYYHPDDPNYIPEEGEEGEFGYYDEDGVFILSHGGSGVPPQEQGGDFFLFPLLPTRHTTQPSPFVALCVSHTKLCLLLLPFLHHGPSSPPLGGRGPNCPGDGHAGRILLPG